MSLKIEAAPRKTVGLAARRTIATDAARGPLEVATVSQDKARKATPAAIETILAAVKRSGPRGATARMAKE